MFSKDKQDLGKAWVMEHEVKLQDEESVYRKEFRLAQEHRLQLIAHWENIPGKGSFKWNRAQMGLLGSPASSGERWSS